MAVGGVGRGGKKGGVGGARGGGASGTGKAGGVGFSKKVEATDPVESTSGAAGASGVAGSSGVSGASRVDALTKQALEIARQLKSGMISSHDEATKKLVSDILKEKLRMQSKALTKRIADALQDDPRLNQKLARLWESTDKG